MASNSGIFTFGDSIGNAGGFKNYSFGQDQGGFYISGMTIGEDKQGKRFDTGAGKKYLGGSVNDLSGDMLAQYNTAMGIKPQMNSLLDTRATDGGIDAVSNDALYQAPNTNAQGSPTDFSVFNEDPAIGGQVDQSGNLAGGTGGTGGSGFPGVQITSTTGGGTTTTVNPTRYSNQLNYLGYKMLSPQDLKRSVTSGQGLGTTQSAGNLSNKALVQRQSLLGR